MASKGRPTDYSQEMADRICDEMCDGKSLSEICRADDMPHRVTVMRWMAKYPDFCSMYARAEVERAEMLADEIISIADEVYNDHDVDDNGNARVNSEAIQRSKLRVEARKWVASKLKPRKYGDFQRTELTGEGGGSIKIESAIDASGLSDSALAELMALRVSTDKAI